MVVATVFALSTLGYVAVDVVLEVRGNALAKKSPEPVVVAEPPPVVVEVPVVVETKIVEKIVAEEADDLMTDSMAMSSVIREKGAGHGKQGIINIGMLDEYFEANDTITLAVLKSKGLIPKKVGRMKVLADGYLNKPLTIKSESYSIEAIKMIELTGGTVIILRD
jgi:ribosomal protein L18E